MGKYGEYLDEDDYQSVLRKNRKDAKELAERIKMEVREKGISHCGQFTTESQVDKAFSRIIRTGLYE